MRKLDEYRQITWSSMVDRWLTQHAHEHGQLTTVAAALPSFNSPSGMTLEDREKWVNARLNYCIRREVAVSDMMSKILHKMLADEEDREANKT